MRFILSLRQTSDDTEAETLIADLPAGHVLGDKGYGSKALRGTIIKEDAIAVIPPRTTSPQVHCDLILLLRATADTICALINGRQTRMQSLAPGPNSGRKMLLIGNSCHFSAPAKYLILIDTEHRTHLKKNSTPLTRSVGREKMK